MPSSYDSSSSSSVQIIGTTYPRSACALATDATTNMVSSTTVASVEAAPAAFSGAVAERYASSLHTQRAVDDLCKRHGVPKAYTARPAGDNRRACTPPPEGAVCVYAHAVEAGLRFPLHPFFSESLTSFGLAPGQVAPNGWRILLGFVLLCHDVGVPPSLPVFRHFFSLVTFSRLRGWYCFRGKDAGGALFTGLPKSNKGWQDRFFFLTSPEPWRCPVCWGEPPSQLTDPALTSSQWESVAKLIGARVAHRTAFDLRTYLSKANLAAAFCSSCLAGELPSPPASVRPTSTDAKGTDQSAKKAVASASGTEKVKSEQGGETSALSRKKKRNREEANSNDVPCHSELSSLPAEQKRQEKSDQNGSTPSRKKRKQDEANSERSTLPADHICSPTCVRAPPGFDPIPRHLPVPDTHGVDSTGRRELAAAMPSDVSPSTHESILQTVNYASSYALQLKKELAARESELEKTKAMHAAERAELEKKLVAHDAEVVFLRGQLKQKGMAGPEDVEFAAALRQVVECEDHVRRRAEHALERYRWIMGGLKCRLKVPPGRVEFLD